MRVIALLITLLLGLNLFAYFYRNDALGAYQVALKVLGVSPEQVPTILLAQEMQSGERRSTPVENKQPKKEASRDQEASGVEQCWQFKGDRATLKTLYQRMRELDIPVVLASAEVQSGSTEDSLIVAETENWQLDVSLATQLRADWPDVVRSQVDCNTVALGAELH